MFDADAQPAQPLPARRVEGSLGVEAEVHQVHHHLHVALRLHIGAHHAERAERHAVLAEETGNDGVEGLLARLQAIHVVRIEAELGAAVLQGDAGAGHHHAGAEAVVVALDERDQVALLVATGQVHRAARPRLAGAGIERALADQRTAAGGVVLVQQFLDRDPHRLRLADVVQPVDVRQLHRLQLAMPGPRAVALAEFEALEDVQGHQGDQALAARRNLPDVIATVVQRDRFDPLRLVAGQVLRAQVAAAALGVADDGPGQLAAIEAFALAARQLVQGVGLARLAEHLAGARRPAVDEELVEPGP